MSAPVKMPIGWIPSCSGRHATRVFKTRGWGHSADLADRIFSLALQHDHHPVVTVSPQQVSVSTGTTETGTITALDAALAAAIDAAAEAEANRR